MGFENFKQIVESTQKGFEAVRPIMEGEIAQSNGFLGNILFPRESTNELVVRRREHHKTNITGNYRNRYEGSRRLITPEFIKDIVATLPHKGNTDVITKQSLNWLTVNKDNAGAQAWARYFGSAQDKLANVMKAIWTLNEFEACRAITLGTLRFANGHELDFPYTDFDRTNQDTLGIAYHTNAHDWFKVDGTVNMEADIMSDFETIKTTVVDRRGRVPEVAIMNRHTFQAIWKNDILNEKVDNLNQPAYWLHFANKDDMITNPLGIQFYVYDEYFYPDPEMAEYLDVDAFSPQKYIPDHVVVFAPRRLGTRWVGPNDENNGTDSYVKTWGSIDEREITVEYGEVSMPMPDDFESLHVAYVKDLGD